MRSSVAPASSATVAPPAIVHGRFHQTSSAPRASSTARATPVTDDGQDAQPAAPRDGADDEGSSFFSLLNHYSASQPGDDSNSGHEKDGKNSQQKRDDSDKSGMVTTPVHTLEKRPEILPLMLAIPQRLDLAAPDGPSTSLSKGADLSLATDGSTDGFIPDSAGHKERKPVPVMDSLTPVDPPSLDVETSAPTAPHGELAFAAKLSSPDSDPAGAGRAPVRASAHAEQRQAAAPAVKGNDAETETAKVAADSPAERFSKTDATFAAPAAAQSQSAATVKSEGPSVSMTPEARLEHTAEPAPAPASSSHDITIRIPDATERGTDVRFVERGGEVHVSVRTSDAQMAQTLRGGLSDFVSRLDHSGIRAEVWQPNSDASSSQKDAQNQSMDQKGSGSGRNQSDSEESTEDQRNAKRPRWVEEMEKSFGGSTGQAGQ